jgi:hypothetical protein
MSADSWDWSELGAPQAFAVSHGGTVGLDGVDNAFEALGDPAAHAKILIDPKSDATMPG